MRADTSIAITTLNYIMCYIVYRYGYRFIVYSMYIDSNSMDIDST